MKVIYLDYNATTPIDSEVADAMIPFLREKFGNPSSIHSFGLEAKKEIEKARKNIAELLNAEPHEIIFTSGGTESNNLALTGIARNYRHRGNHIITSNIEHPAVLEVCKNLEKEGFRVTYLEVDSYGMVDPEKLKQTIEAGTILVSIMHANNELGTIQPIEEIAEVLKGKDIIFHSDAAQSTGKINVDVQTMGVDLLSVAGHKFYGPKGVGALYIREGIKPAKLMHGANHEQNIRPGTENLLEIAGFGKAAEIALHNLAANASAMKKTRDLLYNSLKKEIPEIILNGHPEKRLPNTLNLSIPGIDSSLLLSELKDVAASAGAACHAEEITYSHVLKAIGIDPTTALGTIRLSTGKHTSEKDIEIASEAIVEKVKSLQHGGAKQANNLHSENIKLTDFTHGLGCACKISPRVLEEVLKDMPVPNDPKILIGPETSDDAAVYLINEETALVQSLDFFTPIIDDPFRFGAVAAANALSDIYAMGAKPIFGLNIVSFPHGRLAIEVLKQILAGANEVCKEAGISVLGGHTIEDNEPKFGMVISGIVHPQKIISNSGAKPGDHLILTKAIGTGIMSTAMKREALEPDQTEILYQTMRSLNKTASEVMTDFPVHACTDVTGFGLLGHLKEMCEGSGTGAEIYFSRVPLLPGIQSLAAQGFIPGGTENNLQFVDSFINWDSSLSDLQKYILADAQTSGGLLICIPGEAAEKLSSSLISNGLTANTIGYLNDSLNISIHK